MRELKFGVEIEFFGVSYQTVIDKLREAGIEVRDFNGYTHEVMYEWKVTTDSSVNWRGTGQNAGLELVSPILYDDEGLEELEKVYEVLNEIGAKVDKSCGTHVHFDVADYSIENMISFINLWYNNKNVINYLVPESRRHNEYCTQIYRHDIDEINEKYNRGVIRGIRDIAWVIGTRYKTINLNSYVKYGTVEIRQHGGTTEFSKMEAWIVMIYQMLEVAKSNKVNTIKALRSTPNNFNKFLKEINLDDSCIGDFLTDRFNHFKGVA